MFTRFNVLSIALIFVISVVSLTIFFSNDGILAGKSAEKRINSIQEEVKEKESTINALRYISSSGREKNAESGDVIYSFSDESVFDPALVNTAMEDGEQYIGLTSRQIVLYSLLITLLWSVIIFVVLPLAKRRKTGGRKDGGNTES